MNTKKTFIKKSFMPTNIMFYVLHVNTKTYWGSYNYFIDPLDKSLFFIRKELKNLRVAGNLQNTILPHINSTLKLHEAVLVTRYFWTVEIKNLWICNQIFKGVCI